MIISDDLLLYIVIDDFQTKEGEEGGWANLYPLGSLAVILGGGCIGMDEILDRIHRRSFNKIVTTCHTRFH